MVKMKSQFYHPLLGGEVKEELSQKLRTEPSLVIWRHQEGDYCV